jgi:hypothetical protein
VTFILDCSIDSAELEKFARSTGTTMTSATVQLVRQCEQKLQASLKSNVVINVSVRTLFETDRDRKLVGA